MPRKPARMYREVKQQAFTRREYMGGVPSSKFNVYKMGSLKKEDFNHVIYLKSNGPVQLRSASINSSRISVNKKLTNSLVISSYCFKILKYPFHVIRENKMSTGAGADRTSMGMRLSFGKNVEVSIRLRKDDRLFAIYYKDLNLTKLIKEALVKAKFKLSPSFELEYFSLINK